MSQGINSVDEYFKMMKLVVIQTDVEEDMEDIMARFMNGLNHDITHIMELYIYVKFKEMMYIVIKVEK